MTGICNNSSCNTIIYLIFLANMIIGADGLAMQGKQE